MIDDVLARQLAHDLVQRLSVRRETLATAESCTGGLISSTITDVPGASSVFGFGFVTYANAAKVSLLGVSAKAIDDHGAVSPVVALQMARGARQRAAADFAISVTGIAGPGGGTPEKPVGLVYIATDSGAGAQVHRHLYPAADRDVIRQWTTRSALRHLLQLMASA